MGKVVILYKKNCHMTSVRLQQNLYVLFFQCTLTVQMARKFKSSKPDAGHVTHKIGPLYFIKHLQKSEHSKYSRFLDSFIFGAKGNRTIEKTVPIGDRFNTKTQKWGKSNFTVHILTKNNLFFQPNQLFTELFLSNNI